MNSKTKGQAAKWPAFHLTVDGGIHPPASYGAAVNPATGEKIADYPMASLDGLNAAVAAAKKAFPAWRDTPFSERQRAVCQLGDLIVEHRAAFLELLVTEQGKSLAGAQWEIDSAAYWFHDISKLDLPDEVTHMGDGQVAVSRHIPIGVVAAIVPWNFPVVLAVWKLAPALLMGNTVVLKPSPYTPLCSLLFGELAQRILPPGVLNVIAIPDNIAGALTEHPDVGMISFTGSTETGKKVMRSAAGTLKRTALEMGGNDPAIVLPDADVDAIVPALFWAAFQNSAQFCLATKRLLVHESIYDRFCDAFVRFAATIKVGNGLDPDSQLGPLQNRMQFDKVRGLIEDTQRRGHKFLLGGEIPESPGNFVPVTLVDNPPDDARCVAEEAFGPVLPILKYGSVEEALRRANATHYGLGASVWGSDVEEAKRVARRIEAGVVWINQIHVMSPQVAMGGMKQSGLGVENGRAGLAHYCNLQVVLNKE